MGTLFRIVAVVVMADHLIKTLDGDDMKDRVKDDIYKKSLLQKGFDGTRHIVTTGGRCAANCIRIGVEFADTKLTEIAKR